MEEEKRCREAENNKEKNRIYDVFIAATVGVSRRQWLSYLTNDISDAHQDNADRYQTPREQAHASWEASERYREAEQRKYQGGEVPHRAPGFNRGRGDQSDDGKTDAAKETENRDYPTGWCAH